jgi:hypothetical protein
LAKPSDCLLKLEGATHLELFTMTDTVLLIDQSDLFQHESNLNQGSHAALAGSSSARSLGEHIEHEAALDVLSLDRSHCDVCLDLNTFLKV